MVLLNGFEPSTSPLPKVCSLKDGQKSLNNSEHCLTFFYLHPLVAKWLPNERQILKALNRWCCRWDLNPRPLPYQGSATTTEPRQQLIYGAFSNIHYAKYPRVFLTVVDWFDEASEELKEKL